MPCYHPISAYLSLVAGKKLVTFKQVSDCKSIKLPCGRCIGCKLERSRQWAVRLMHERTLHEKACFITLTFNPESVPYPPSLDVKVFQDFMKRLRRWQDDWTSDGPIRFFHAGEYGDNFGRPHYHAILFGQDFSGDRVPFKKSERGDQLYVSEDLSDRWPFGFSSIGDCTFESAAYVARYCTKKVTGRNAFAHYDWVDDQSGEVFALKPEYATMSRRPGIGSGWLEKFSSDVYPSDEVVVRGRAGVPPKFYDRRLEKFDPELFGVVKEAREFALEKSMLENPAEYTEARLAVKETVKLAQINSIKRKL